MSQHCLLAGTRDFLRQPCPPGQIPSALGNFGVGHLVQNPKAEIDVRPPPGRPINMAGEVYIAIWVPSWVQNSTEGLNEEFQMHVTVSVRAPRKPDDRYADLIIGSPFQPKPAQRGILFIARQCALAMHLNYNLLALVNTYMNREIADLTAGAQTAATPFVEPLFMSDGGQTEERGGSWFKGTPKEQSAALVQTLTFRPARRVQEINPTPYFAT